MGLLLDDQHPHSFSPPDGLIKVAICSTTGTLACSGCPKITEQYFEAGTQPTTTCNPSWFTNPAAPAIGKPAAGSVPRRDRLTTDYNLPR